MVRTYRTGLLSFLFLPLGIVFCAWFTLLGPSIAVNELVVEGHPLSFFHIGASFGALAMGVGFGCLLYLMLRWLRVAVHTVRLGDDGSCEFCGLRRRRLQASDLAWMRAERDDEDNGDRITSATVGYRAAGTYQDKTLTLGRPWHGFAQLVAHLKQVNRQIQIDPALESDTRWYVSS
jgi:hypothetical protein